MEHLKGPQPSVSTNFAVSHLLSEDLKTDMSKNTKNSKNRREVSSRLPSFMKPTACSQHRIGLTKHIPVNNRTKPPVPPKRRPSSVYAESVRLPVNPTTWQSECSSECSISMTSDMNWMPSVEDGTECSQQDTSEYETKQVIFSEHEKLLQDQLISHAECQLAESGKMQNKTEEMGIIDIDSWIHQQIIENSSISEKVLDIPEVTEYGTYDSSTASPIQECIKGDKQTQDNGSNLKLQTPVQIVEGIKQAKAIDQLTSMELCTPPSKQLCNNEKMNEHKNERLAYHGKSRRSLQEMLDKCMPGHPDTESFRKNPDKESKTDPIIQPEIRLQDGEHYIGKVLSNIRQCGSKQIYFKIKGCYCHLGFV
jgi:kinesin family protein C2/C3